MPIDNTIALQVQTPNVMNTMGNMLDVANKNQQVQQGQMDLQERNALRDLSKNLDQYKREDGNLDLNRLVNDATQAAPKLGMKFATELAQAHVEGVVLNKSLFGLSEEKRSAMGKVAESVATQPFDVQEKMFRAVANSTPGGNIWADINLKHLKNAWEHGGAEAAKQTAYQIAKGTVGVTEQNNLNTPEFTQTQNRAGKPFQVNKNPMAEGGIGGSAMPTGLSLTEGGTAQTVNQDYAGRIASSRDAARNVGVLENIGKYAEGAITGVGGDRRAWIAGLSGLLGMSEEQLAKTNTDLLMKNEKMLALTGGDTNLAKNLAESANPNSKMTPQAIKGAVRQVVAQQKMNIEGAKHLGQFLGDYKAYNKELNDWNSNADPRILELPHMTPEERKHMAESMGPAKAKEFAEKVRFMQERGVLK